jgi:hypothetical protein
MHENKNFSHRLTLHRYGGLDMAVMGVFGGQLTWCADNDKNVATILSAHP